MSPFTLRLHHMGANRGGRAFANALTRELGVRRLEVTVADPKPGRASDLGAYYASQGGRSSAFAARCEEVLPALDPDAPVVLTIDEIAPMAQIVRDPVTQVVLAQGVARGARIGGSPAAVFGVSLASIGDRPSERLVTARLLSVLAERSPPRSSSAIRESGLDAIHLQRERQVTSEATAKRVAELERTRDEETLARLFFAGVDYPLVLANQTAGRTREAREEAIEVASGQSGSTAVALVGRDRVDFYVIEAPKGLRRATVRLWVPFEPPPPAPASSALVNAAPVSVPASQPVFTD